MATITQHLQFPGIKAKRKIYIFKADTKELYTEVMGLEAAARIIQKRADGIHGYIKNNTPVNGFILSHDRELTEKFNTKFI